MDKVKEDGNMGTGGGRLKNPKDSKNGRPITVGAPYNDM